MIVLVVSLAPLVLGFLLIALIARYSPNVPRHSTRSSSEVADDRPAITPDEFEDIIQELLGALGLDIVFSSAGTGGVLEITARDPRPLSGGRLLVHASPVVGSGQVDAAEVLGFADSVRGDMGALKGIFIAAAGFTDEAHAAIRSTPAQVELVDAQKLVELVRAHLPDRAELLESYRSFSSEGRRHSRANQASGDDSRDDGPAQGKGDAPVQANDDGPAEGPDDGRDDRADVSGPAADEKSGTGAATPRAGPKAGAE